MQNIKTMIYILWIQIRSFGLNTFEFIIFMLTLDGRAFDYRGFAEIRISLDRLHKLNIFYNFIIIIIINSMVSIILPPYGVLGFKSFLLSECCLPPSTSSKEGFTEVWAFRPLHIAWLSLTFDQTNKTYTTDWHFGLSGYDKSKNTSPAL